MLEDLIATIENEGCALLLADPHANGRAAMLSVGDVHYVQQLLRNGAESYAAMFEPHLIRTVMQ